MQVQVPSSIQFDSGKTRMLSPMFTRPLYRFHGSRLRAHAGDSARRGS